MNLEGDGHADRKGPGVLDKAVYAYVEALSGVAAGYHHELCLWLMGEQAGPAGALLATQPRRPTRADPMPAGDTCPPSQ